MALSPISLPSIETRELPQDPVITPKLKNIRVESSIFSPSEHKGASLLSDNICSTLKSSDSILNNEKKKSEVTVKSNQQKKNNKGINKSTKGSNKVSNRKKAQGHIIALSLTTVIGAVLAPLTGGMSLLPTAFLVVYGNAAAIAMYGGSKHFIDDQKKQDQEAESEKTPYNSTPTFSPNTFRFPKASNLERNEPRLFENDNPDNQRDKSLPFNKEIPNTQLEKMTSTFPDTLIANENIIKTEHQPQRLVGDVLEYQLIDNDTQDGDKAILEDAFTQLLRTPISKCTRSVQNLSQANFSRPIDSLFKEKGIKTQFNTNCIASEPIHSSNNLQIFAIRNIPEISKSADLNEPKNDNKSTMKEKKRITAPMDYLKKPVISSIGSAISMHGNYQSGVRNNVVGSQVALPEKVASKSQMTTADSAKPKHYAITAPMDYLRKPVITSIGSAISMHGNYQSGVRNNVVGSQAALSEKAALKSQLMTTDAVNTKQHAITAPMDYLKKSIITSIGSAISMHGNYQSGVRNNVNDFIKNHSESVRKLADSYWINTGIDKPISLVILNNSLAVSPIDQEKLDYIPKKK